MTLATIIYNASSGSDTAASGGNAPTSAITGTNGDMTGTPGTLTLNETVDFTAGSGVNDNNTDVLWVDTPAGDRHLFRIDSYTGGKATCTAIVCFDAASATRTADSWAVGGKRKTPDNDTSNPDIKDAKPGWVYEYEGTGSQYTYQTASTPVVINVQGTVADGPITMRAASGATPIIDWTEEAILFQIQDGGDYDFQGLTIQNTTATGGLSKCFDDMSSDPTLRFSGCTLLCSGYCIDAGSSHITIIDCDMRSTTLYVIRASTRVTVYMHKTIIHDCGSEGVFFTTTNSSTVIVATSCIFRNNGGSGVLIQTASVRSLSMFLNCIFHQNTNDGIRLDSTTSVDYGPFVSINCIFSLNGGYGISSSTTSQTAMLNLELDFNAFYSNTSGEVNSVIKGSNSITLSADPYTNEATNDFTLNNTSGGGADCRDTGQGYSG